MKDLVTKDKGSYFGRRSRISGALALILMFIAGFILDYFKQTKIFIGFTILFSLAFLGRFISAMLFTKQYDPRLELKEGYYFSFWQFIKKMPYNNYGRFSIFLALLNIAVSISSPFFAIYLLEDLKLKSMQFGYIFYTIICMSASITTLLVMASWGKFADKYGNYRVMKITSYFIPLIPLYWVCSSFLIGKISIIWMTVFFVIFEGISGVIWAGFNLSSSNYIYDAVTKERMALCVAYLNVLSGFGVFIGAVFGGYISSLKFSFFGLSPILFIFLLSALARFFVVFFMVPRIKEVRDGVINLDIKDKIKKDIKEEIEVASKSLKKFHAIDFILGLHNRFGRQKFVE
jgi:MFS family permease